MNRIQLDTNHKTNCTSGVINDVGTIFKIMQVVSAVEAAVTKDVLQLQLRHLAENRFRVLSDLGRFGDVPTGPGPANTQKNIRKLVFLVLEIF